MYVIKGIMNVEELKRVISSQRQAMEELLKSGRIAERLVDKERLRGYLAQPNILAILGVRRSGKSVLTWLLLKDMKFGYINFADERLRGMKAEELDSVMQAFAELYGEMEYVAFDEIQNVEGWELFLTRLRTTKRIIATGSNSRMLSRELATSLTGRHVDFELFPFSYAEYMAYRKKSTVEMETVEQVAELKNGLRDYVGKGGFPEAEAFGTAILQGIYGDILEKDIAVRHSVRKLGELRELAVYLMSNIGKEVTLERLKEAVGIRSSITIGRYVRYLEEGYLVVLLNRFSYKLKEQFKAPKKAYCIDTGLANAVSFRNGADDGRLIENVVLVELLRRRSYRFARYGVYYWKDHAQREVDFVIKEGDSVAKLIQVSYVSDARGLKEREIEALVKASDELRCDSMLIITWDYEGEIERHGKRIAVVPLWKWLLEEEKTSRTG